MAQHVADPHDHSIESTSEASSPVPAQWIPWVVMALAAALIIAGFTILFAIRPY